MITPLVHEEARAAKAALRKSARTRIRAMGPKERLRADEAVCARLAALATEVNAPFVVAYIAFADEVRLDGLLATLVERGTPALLPHVNAEGDLELGLWRPDVRLTRDREGVLAPPPGGRWTGRGGVLVVPGRVFDTEGGRIGRGLGYYDRFLQAHGADGVVAGAAYECQVVERVPREAHDRGVDCLMTEAARRDFGRT